MQSQQSGSVQSRDFRQHNCFDGTEGRSLDIRSSGSGKEFYSGSVQPTLMRQAIAPFDLAALHQGRPISEHLAAGARIIGSETWDGHQVTVVETKATSNNGEYMTRYWVDPERDNVVVRRRNFMRKSSDSVWKVTYSVDCFKHAKSKTGIWLPKIAWAQTFNLATNDEEQGSTLMRTDLRCDAWVVNTELESQKLHFDFPAGLRVQGLAKDKKTEGEKLLAVKRGSRIQADVVDALRKLGFGDIRLSVQIGYGNFNSDYPQ